jgi:hypothetical protein
LVELIKVSIELEEEEELELLEDVNEEEEEECLAKSVSSVKSFTIERVSSSKAEVLLSSDLSFSFEDLDSKGKMISEILGVKVTKPSVSSVNLFKCSDEVSMMENGEEFGEEGELEEEGERE